MVLSSPESLGYNRRSLLFPAMIIKHITRDVSSISIPCKHPQRR